jgi:hypothetical protein
MNYAHRFILPALLSAAILGCGMGNDSFTLYRNSVMDKDLRIHVASFDAADGETYNKENCEQAQQLFQSQPGVKTKFWCEKGVFRK